MKEKSEKKYGEKIYNSNKKEWIMMFSLFLKQYFQGNIY